MEGGIWQAEAGPLAYAFPTYEGTGPKTDLPAAERDQIQAIDALNEAGRRLAEAHPEAESMRNPIAAARLQGENALAGNDARRREAIGDMLEQMDRLDGLVGKLLAMTERVVPKPVQVDLDTFLAGQVARHRDTAAWPRVPATARRQRSDWGSGASYFTKSWSVMGWRRPRRRQSLSPMETKILTLGAKKPGNISNLTLAHRLGCRARRPEGRRE